MDVKIATNKNAPEFVPDIYKYGHMNKDYQRKQDFQVKEDSWMKEDFPVRYDFQMEGDFHLPCPGSEPYYDYGTTHDQQVEGWKYDSFPLSCLQSAAGPASTTGGPS